MSSSKTKNTRSSMTYDQLMDSHFLKFPGHSKVVHTIFNPWVIMVIIVIAVAMYSLHMGHSISFAIGSAVLCGLYMQGKLLMIGMQMTGHGVGIIKKGKFSFLGLPTVATVCLLVLFTIILFLNYTAFITAPSNDPDFNRVRVLAVSLLFSFAMAMLSWRFHTYYETWYGSEYDARYEFKYRRGYSEEEVERRIKILRSKGYIQY
ncbi:MAG: hypothetical protein JWM92_68 [Candidatus Nomurabacteria bacterium]|nr:hypothetical protein [Candidatus Nomurabacteria bacterium]